MELEKLYRSLNPLQLSRQINRETKQLLWLASRPAAPLSWSEHSNHGSKVPTLFGNPYLRCRTGELAARGEEVCRH